MPRKDGHTQPLTKGQRKRRRRLGTQKWQDLTADPNMARVGKTRTGRQR